MIKNNWTSAWQFLYISDRFQVRGNTIIGKLVKNEYCPRNGEEANILWLPSPETGLIVYEQDQNYGW